MRREGSHLQIERMAALALMLRKQTLRSSVQAAAALECTERTIRRDLEFMRDRLLYAISYDSRLRRWTGTAPKERIL